tara:strand:+ start:89 stop:1018 length:930 start_codon:yes stop_codon:yes gene_type:complete
MAYRDPVFNANVLTDLLGSYLDLKNKEREKYYQAEQKKDKDKTVIRQGEDGFLYYINPKTRETSRVFENIQQKPTKPTLKDLYNKDTGESKIVKEQNGSLFDLTTNEPLTSDELKGYTFKAPTKPPTETVSAIRTGFNAEDNSEIKYFQKGKSFYLLDKNPDTANAQVPMTAEDWSNIYLKKSDDSEKKELKKGMIFLTKRKLQPLYNKYQQDLNASDWQKGTPNYNDMLKLEGQLIKQYFPKSRIYNSIEEIKKNHTALESMDDKTLRKTLKAHFDMGVKGEGSPPIILHEDAFGKPSDLLNILNMMQ